LKGDKARKNGRSASDHDIIANDAPKYLAASVHLAAFREPFKTQTGRAGRVESKFKEHTNLENRNFEGLQLRIAEKPITRLALGHFHRCVQIRPV
jgi:hypothetical protein